MQKSNQNKINAFVLFCTIWVYYSLNARYINLSVFAILRWIFPVLLIGMAAFLNNGRIAAPPMLLLWFTLAVIPPSLLGADPTSSIIKFISWVLIFCGSYIYFCQVRSEEGLQRCFAVLCTVLVVFQILNFAFTIMGINEVSGRSTGITTNANTLGIYSNLAFWAGIYWRSRTKHRFMRVMWIVFLLTTAYTAIASGSRTAFVVLIVDVMVLIFLMQKRHRSFLLLAAGIGVFVWMLLNGKLDFLGIAAVDRLAEEGGTRRDLLWDMAIEIWKENKLFGVGYTVSARFNYVDKMGFHNSYLSLLVECGLWGTIIAGLAILPTVFAIVSRFGKRSAVIEDKDACIVCGMLISLAIAAWSESFMFAVGSTEGFTFWFLLAWIMVYIKQMKKRS